MSASWRRVISLSVIGLAVAVIGLAGCSTAPTYTYSIRSAGPVHTRLGDFASSVAGIYSDSRGWGHNGMRFKQVASGGDFVVWIATADQLPRFSPGCSTGYICTVG